MTNPQDHAGVLKRCPFCDGPTHFRTEGDVTGCYHRGRARCPVGRWTMTVEQWNHRTPDLEAQLEQRTEALREAREAIASLDEDALGEVITGYNRHGEPESGHMIRDELLAKIDAALAPPSKEMS